MLNNTAYIILYLVKQKPFYSVSLLFLSLFATVCNVIGTTLLIPIFYISVGGQNQFSTSKFLQVVNNLFAHLQPQQRLLAIVAILFLVILFKNIANYISKIVGFKQVKNTVYQMKTEGIDLLCKVDFDYYQKNKTREILLKLNREIERAALALDSLQKVIIISITIVLLTAILIVISWQLTFVAAITLVIIIWIDNWLRFKASKARSASVEANQLSNRRLIEFLSGIRLIKTVANETAEYQAIASSIEDKNREQLRTQMVSATIEPIREVGGIIMVLSLTVASYYLYARSISTIAPVLLIYLAVLFRLLPFISQFDRARLQYINIRSSLDVVASFLDRQNKPISSSSDRHLVNLKTEIEFRAVTFAYPDRGQIILDRIDLTIPQGKTIALVGFPGTGNSTISDLLTRFYEPIEGKILLDGIDLREYKLHSLRKAIAVISRDTFLFNNSLAYNIAYGIENATDRDIIDAAKKAQIDRFIELPAGLATRVGEQGITLSAAQKQRISLARAFLRHPQIVILDEPFDLLDRSFIDLESVQQTINFFTCECTTLIITKQLNLAKMADRIIVFNQGKIIETGTHQQLLQQGNIYQRLYSIQFKATQQSRQLNLAQKIARKLAQQDYLSTEIRLNLNTLMNHLDSLDRGLLEETILDESFQSAQDVLASLKAYEQKISQGEIDD